MERKSIWLDILAVAAPVVARGLLVGLATALVIAGMLPPDAARCLLADAVPADGLLRPALSALSSRP